MSPSAANRRALARHRARAKIDAYWRAQFGDDPDLAHKMLDADDVRAAEFAAVADTYPHKEKPKPAVTSPYGATQAEAYETAAREFDLPEDGRPMVVNVDTAAKKRDTTFDDIDQAQVDEWAKMQADACNQIAKTRRQTWKGDDPVVEDHNPDGCARCGWKSPNPRLYSTDYDEASPPD